MSTPDIDRLLVTADEARRMLAIGRTQFGDMYRSGQIPCVRLGRRVVRFSVEDLRAWIVQNKQSAA